MYSFTTSGGNVIVKDISNPNPSNQTVVATVVSTSSDVTWSYTAEEDKVKFYVAGIELVPSKFATIQVDGSYCTSKADFVSKIISCLSGAQYLNAGGGSSSAYVPVSFVDVSSARDLLLTDAGKVLLVVSGSAIVITIPTNEDVAFELGTEITVAQMGTGQVSFDVGVGVETRSKDNLVALTGQYSAVTLIQNEIDVWLIVGDLSA